MTDKVHGIHQFGNKWSRLPKTNKSSVLEFSSFVHTESDGMQKANKIFSPKIMDFEYKRSYPNTFQRFMTKIRVNPIISIFRVNPLIPNFFFQHRRSIGSSFRPARKFGRFEG